MSNPLNPGFDFFSLFPYFFGIIFVIVIGVFITTAIKGISQWRKNEQSPELSVPAIVRGKRTNVNSSTHGENHHSRTRTTYYATFEYESGDRQEFHLSDSEYAQIAEEDLGILTFKGTRFLGFERSKENYQNQ
jgi:hypothetical protein